MLTSRVQGCCFLIIVFIPLANSDGHALDKRGVASHLGVSTKDRQFRKFFGFLHKYKKNYENANLSDRFKVFKDNLKKIKELNKEELGTAVYGITQFTDLTTDEFLSRYGTTSTIEKQPKHIGQSIKNGKSGFRKLTIKKPPKTCDWRYAKPPIVTPIRNQGRCNSCWIFAATALLEIQYQLRARLKKQPHFSEQQILDCGLNITCNTTSYPETAFNIIKKRLKSKIADRSVYPYLNEEYRYHESGKGQCVRDRQPNYKIKNLENTNFWRYPGLKKGDDKENFMARYIAENGPIVAFIMLEWAQNEGYLYMVRGKDMCYVTSRITAVNMSPNIHRRYKEAGCPKHTYLPKNPYKQPNLR